VLGTDALQIVLHRAVAGEDEMVAVVDGQPERLVEIGAAAAAGLRRAFDEDDLAPGLRQRRGGGEPGQSAAHDINRAHPSSP